MKKIALIILIVFIFLVGSVIGATLQSSFESIRDSKIQEKVDSLIEKNEAIDTSSLNARIVKEPVCVVESPIIQMCTTTIEIPYGKDTYTFEFKYNSMADTEDINKTIIKKSRDFLTEQIPDIEVMFTDTRYTTGDEFPLLGQNELVIEKEPTEIVPVDKII